MSGRNRRWRPFANALGQPFARVFLPQGASPSEIISGQWAVGRYVDAWFEQLSHAKSWTEEGQSDDKHWPTSASAN